MSVDGGNIGLDFLAGAGRLRLAVFPSPSNTAPPGGDVRLDIGQELPTFGPIRLWLGPHPIPLAMDPRPVAHDGSALVLSMGASAFITLEGGAEIAVTASEPHLSVPIYLAGDGVVAVDAAGDLSWPLYSEGEAQVVVSAAGDLTTEITMTGDGAVAIAADPALLAVGYAIEGTVFEEGVAVARTVRAYRRDTGALMGEAVSSSADGSYRLGLLTERTEADVLAIPADGYRPLVHGPILPEPQ